MHILVKGAILPCYIHRAIFTIYYWCIFHICLYFCLGCLVEILKILKEFLVFCGANSVADTFCSIFFCKNSNLWSIWIEGKGGGVE